MTKKPTTQKMKFSIKDFFSKFNQIHKKMWILSHLLNYKKVFVCSGLNNLSLLIYFQKKYIYIYIFSVPLLFHNAVSFQTTFNY